VPPVSASSLPPFDASRAVRSHSSSRHLPDPLVAGLFPHRSRPRLLTDAPCGGLGSPPVRRARRVGSSITVTARFMLGDLLHRHHSPFRTHQHTVVWVPRLHGELGGPTSITGTAPLQRWLVHDTSSTFVMHAKVDLDKRLFFIYHILCGGS